MELSLSLKAALASRSLLVEGQHVEDTVAVVGSALCRHRLRVMRHEPPFARPVFCGVRTDEIGIFYLRYGSPVEVVSRWPNDCYLVQATLAGQGSFEADGLLVETRASTTVLALPGQTVRSTSTAACERLLVRIDRGLIDRELERRCAAGGRRPPALRPVFTEAAARSWGLAVAHFLTQRQVVPEPTWTRMQPSLVGGLAAILLDLQGDAALPGGPGPLPGSVRRAIRLIEENLADVLTPDGVARRAGVAPRTLNAHFRRFLNATPSAYIRQARLTRLDLALRDPVDARSISEMMMDCGIAHHGRFSTYYRQRFGILPSQRRDAALSEAETNRRPRGGGRTGV